MALVIDEIRQRVDGPGEAYVSPVRLCLTADERVVEDTDPDAVILLVPKGGTLPKAVAEKYGLVGEPTPHPDVPGEPSRAELIAQLEEAQAELEALRATANVTTGDGGEAEAKEARPAANKGRKAATEDKTSDAPTP